MTWPCTRASTAHKARRKALADHLAVNAAVLASARISCFLICSLALRFCNPSISVACLRTAVDKRVVSNNGLQNKCIQVKTTLILSIDWVVFKCVQFGMNVCNDNNKNVLWL